MKLEPLERAKAEIQNTSAGTFIAIGLIALLMIFPLVNILQDNNRDLLSRLKNRGVLSWIEDTSSEALVSAGKYAPESALMTATGSCRIWIYPDSASADAARDNYINNNLEFSASWSGSDSVTKTEVILLTLEPASYCSKEAALLLNWTLD